METFATLIFRTSLNSIYCKVQTKALLLCGKSEGGCGGGGWTWNWLRDREKQNEFSFFVEEIFKRELQLFSKRRKVERVEKEKVTNKTSRGMRKLCIPRVDKKDLAAKGTMHLSYLKYSFQKCIMHQ